MWIAAYPEWLEIDVTAGDGFGLDAGNDVDDDGEGGFNMMIQKRVDG